MSTHAQTHKYSLDKKMITVHTMAYNEEVLIQFMIDHYRSRFPKCHAVNRFVAEKNLQLHVDNEMPWRDWFIPKPQA